MTATLQVPTEALRELALANGVCIRPVIHEVTDNETGRVRLVPTPCGATLAGKCPPCAQRNRALRMHQCREGWHLEKEPDDAPRSDDTDPREVLEHPDRRVRSTRHRQDMADLPSLPIENRTIGTAFTTPTGRTYRPSMFATFTLPSYGRVRPDGTPVDPSTYDYRRAALDALHFPKLVDRLWQNLRRSLGWKVQYFSVVEPQRRLAPHLHAALRGAIPRETFRQVVAATYHQVWWPPHQHLRYTGAHLPTWDGRRYLDPVTGEPLPTWDQALDRLDAAPEIGPCHVVRFGTQVDVQGIIATEDGADRAVGYLTKYLAKSFGQAHAEPGGLSPRQRRHLERLHREVRWLPCSPRCGNWLRYGIQPLGTGPAHDPGSCPSKAHDRDHLGCGGRRVLVSRKWTGKTLDRHRADRAEVVRQVLLTAGVEPAVLADLSTAVTGEDGQPRYQWQVWNPLVSSAPVYRQILTRTIAQRVRWRTDYQTAKESLATAPQPP